jgi:hypothetical protein
MLKTRQISMKIGWFIHIHAIINLKIFHIYSKQAIMT